MRVLTILPMRAGSKGAKGKNLRLVCGKPLFYWTISEAHKAGLVPFVSTESKEIADAVAPYARVIMRPSELATDTALCSDVIQHAIDTVPDEYDAVVCLQVTSPLRSVADIQAGLALLKNHASVIAYTEYSKPEVRIDDKGQVHPLFSSLNRQDEQAKYVVTGSFYGSSVDAFKSWGGFYSPGAVGLFVPVERSLDIDTEYDLLVADLLLRHRLEQDRVARIPEVDE